MTSVWQGDIRLASLTAMSAGNDLSSASIDLGCRYRLSRFAYLHTVGEEAVVETPLSPARLVLHDWRAAALVHALSSPRLVGDLGRVTGVEAESARSFLQLLLACRVAVREAGQDEFAEADPALCSWEFHDLLFHSRSRKGRHAYPVGGTYRFLGSVDPIPSVKSRRAADTIQLYRPDIPALIEKDPSLTWVQEHRRSVRSYNNIPISDIQLGEFLYRVGRLVDFWKVALPTSQGVIEVEFASRPYPSGGASYALELYVAVNACSNVQQGLYYYDPERHSLDRINDDAAEFRELVQDAAMSAGIAGEDIQILFIVTARFGRVAWKYASIAYALILKDLGCLYETMYLVATAMGLGPCALGAGNSDLFARAAVLNYYEESSVGEFLLGSCRGLNAVG